MTTVLVADDDFDLRTIVTDLLTSSGYAILSASNGEEALEIATAQRPDLVVLDISMPRMDGYTVVKHLRENPETSRMPIIAFTAHALKGDAEKALKAGYDGYIAKPFQPDELLNEIARLLKK